MIRLHLWPFRSQSPRTKEERTWKGLKESFLEIDRSTWLLRSYTHTTLTLHWPVTDSPPRPQGPLDEQEHCSNSGQQAYSTQLALSSTETQEFTSWNFFAAISLIFSVLVCPQGNVDTMIYSPCPPIPAIGAAVSSATASNLHIVTRWHAARHHVMSRVYTYKALARSFLQSTSGRGLNLDEYIGFWFARGGITRCTPYRWVRPVLCFASPAASIPSSAISVSHCH